MNQERWKQVNQIFHEAADLPPCDQDVFVRLATETDPELASAVINLLQADRQGESYLSRPALLDQQLAASLFPVNLVPGDFLASRFRIDREVGSGGMGKVFEAYDMELRVRIALKVIHPEVAEDITSIERFRQEVRLARKITHPNVCRTYDLERATATTPDGRSIDYFFLTMEFLEGETLSQRIHRDGTVTGEEFIHIARQIADGLDAAHQGGIIHRDIKPQNIFLVNADDAVQRIVITDFGLARVHAAAEISSTFSLAEGPVGTLSYMAPEQIDGSRVSPATDVYAYGLVLFEMLSGRAAFPSENLIAGLARRLKDPASDAGLIVPGAPAAWIATIHRCIRLNPQHRFLTAGTAAAALSGRRAHAPLVPLPTARQWLVLVCLVLLVALLFAKHRYYQTEAISSLPTGTLVYLAPVENRTGNASLNNLTELLRSSLSQSAHITLLDQGREADIVQQMKKIPGQAIDAAAAREIAMRSSAARVILASVSGSDSAGYQLDVNIQQPDNTPSRYRKHAAAYFSWKSPSAARLPADLFAAVRDASVWIRYKVGESANDIARLDAPPEDVTTSHWEALAKFSQAQVFAGHAQHEQAITSLQDAVALDPGFALAYARMGDILVSINRASEGYQAYDKALGAALQQRLTLRERDRIKGYYAMDTWNYQGAVTVFRDYLLYYPEDAAAQAYYGYALFETGQVEPAIAALKQSYAIDPSRSATLVHLATYFLHLGEIKQSQYWNSMLRSKDADLYQETLGLQLFYLHRYDESQAAFQTLLGSSRAIAHSGGFFRLTRLAAERGQTQQAMTAVEGALHEARSAGNHSREAIAYVDRAALRCHNRHFSACADDVHLALTADKSPSLLLRAAQVLGNALAGSQGGDRAVLTAALDTLERAMPVGETTIMQITKLHVRAELLLAHGKPERAVSLLQEADALAPAERQHVALARAAFAAARQATSAAKALALLDLADQNLLAELRPPGAHWQASFIHPPGQFADSIDLYLRVAEARQAPPAPDIQETFNLLRTSRN
jgi:serine/threonine protein kinase/tetratricopeptide (TPR) repeat protein